MLVIKIWCLPKTSQEKLNGFFQRVVDVLKNIPVFDIRSEKDILVLFPTDMMEYGLGSEILVEVSNLGSNFKISNRDFQAFSKKYGTSDSGITLAMILKEAGEWMKDPISSLIKDIFPETRTILFKIDLS